MPAGVGFHEQILEIESRFGKEGRVYSEEQSVTGGFSVEPRQQDLGGGMSAE